MKFEIDDRPCGMQGKIRPIAAQIARRGICENAHSSTSHMFAAGEATETQAGWAKFQIKFSTNLYNIFLMLWYQYRQVSGRQDTMLVADSREAHVFKEPRHGKDGPQCADMAFAVWNGIVRDAKRHARQWRPIEQALHGSKDVGLRARARSRSSLCKSSYVSLVDLVLVQGCIVLLKNFNYV